MDLTILQIYDYISDEELEVTNLMVREPYLGRGMVRSFGEGGHAMACMEVYQ